MTSAIGRAGYLDAGLKFGGALSVAVGGLRRHSRLVAGVALAALAGAAIYKYATSQSREQSDVPHVDPSIPAPIPIPDQDRPAPSIPDEDRKESESPVPIDRDDEVGPPQSPVFNGPDNEVGQPESLPFHDHNNEAGQLERPGIGDLDSEEDHPENSVVSDSDSEVDQPRGQVLSDLQRDLDVQSQPVKQTWAKRCGGAFVNGVRTHRRLIIGVALAAFVGVAIYGHLTSQAIHTLCFKDAANPKLAWCADLAQSADPVHAVYKQYRAFDDWARSDSLIPRSYEDVKNGVQFVYKTATSYFSRPLFG